MRSAISPGPDALAVVHQHHHCRCMPPELRRPEPTKACPCSALLVSPDADADLPTCAAQFLRGMMHLRPRTNTIAAVARIRNALSKATHDFFQTHGFLYLHTPLITTSDCEGAGEMFQVAASCMTEIFFPLSKSTAVAHAAEAHARSSSGRQRQRARTGSKQQGLLTRPYVRVELAYYCACDGGLWRTTACHIVGRAVYLRSTTARPVPCNEQGF